MIAAALVLIGALLLAGCQAGESPAAAAPGADVVTQPVSAPSGAAPPAGEATLAGPPEAVDAACLAESSNPFAQSIAGTYETAYADVMAWYCAGYSFDNILIALETSKQTGTPVESARHEPQPKLGSDLERSGFRLSPE